jgi:hypothetical protein
VNYYSDHSKIEQVTFHGMELHTPGGDTLLYPVFFADTVVAWATSKSNSEDITAALNNSPKKLEAEAKERLDNQGHGIPYDLKPLYHEEITAPLMEIQRICRQHGLPHVIVFQTQHNGKIPTLTIAGEMYPGRETAEFNGLKTAVMFPNILRTIHQADIQALIEE